MTDPTLQTLKRRVLEPDLCVRSGVYTAIDNSLTMRLNERGEYEYEGLDDSYRGPVADLLKVSAFGVTPTREEEVAAELYSTFDEVNFHSVLGFYQGLFAGYVAEEEYRSLGSSGGIATWLLVELLRTNRIDGVIHIVPGSRGGPLFSYRLSHTEDEIRRGAKSRYYPGQLSEVLTEISLSDGRYALTAIPSFAYEVRLLQRLRPEYRAKIPYIIGLICGHQKTAAYALQLAWRAGIEPSQLDYIDFRRKVKDQPANRYTTEFQATIDGQQVVKTCEQDELLGTDWGMGFFKSNFSDFTEDVFNETADIVLGDAWLPQYSSDSRGTNVVITRHPELHKLIADADAAGRVSLEPLPEEQMLKSQGSLVRQNVDELHERFGFVSSNGGYTPNPRRQRGKNLSFLRRRIQIERYRISQLSHRAWVTAVEADNLGAFDVAVAPAIRRYRWAQKCANVRNLPARFLAKVRRIFG